MKKVLSLVFVVLIILSSVFMFSCGAVAENAPTNTYNQALADSLVEVMTPEEVSVISNAASFVKIFLNIYWVVILPFTLIYAIKEFRGISKRKKERDITEVGWM